MLRAPLPERLTAQALAGELLRSPEAVAERLLAVQGQDPRGARLAVRARTSGVTAADVPNAGQALIHLRRAARRVVAYMSPWFSR